VRVRSKFFSEAENFTDFRSLARFKDSILSTDFTAHLKCFQLLFHFTEHIPAIFILYVLICGQLLVHLYAMLSGYAAYVKCFINHAAYGK